MKASVDLDLEVMVKVSLSDDIQAKDMSIRGEDIRKKDR